MRRIVRISLAILLVLVIAGIVAYFTAGTKMFLINRVEVIGTVTVDAKDVVALSGISADDSLLSISTGDIQKRVETDTLLVVKRVRRCFPDAIEITVTEREAVALVKRGTRLMEASGDGFIIRDNARSLDLPVLSRFSGDGGTKDAELTETLSTLAALRTNNAALYGMVSEIVSTGDEFLVYPRQFKVTAILARPLSIERLTKLQALIAMLRQSKEQASTIDLRFKDAVIR
ncbi:MAG: FtsQ-type POTRA domain-containing protein [Spirochaetes bacterium]|nr:FtsQ-type POTRA domain-containing protein [Spirochaetota bacterium]